MSSSIRFHAILLRDGIHCGTHCSATKGDSHYKYAHNLFTIKIVDWIGKYDAIVELNVLEVL